jgi:hypothetical protein
VVFCFKNKIIGPGFLEDFLWASSFLKKNKNKNKIIIITFNKSRHGFKNL